MLEIIKEIKANGLQKTIDKYGLLFKPAKSACDICKGEDCCQAPKADDCLAHKFLLKYSQIASAPFKALDAVRECRGLILTKDLQVMSYMFKRFPNLEEDWGETVDLGVADLLFKEDGSITGLYFDWIYGAHCVQTSGTPEGDVPVGAHNMTFADLFWDVFETYNVDMTKLDPRKNYVFELCTKYNQVVAMHEEPKLVLLNVRNLDDLSEATYPELVEIGKEIGIPAVHSFDLNSEAEVREMFEQMSKEEEGIVAYDGKNRVKIKNPAYVIAHRSETNYQPKHQFKIIQMNEQDEFIGVLNRFRGDYYKAEHFWLKLVVEGYKLRDKASEYIRKGTIRESTERAEHERWQNLMADAGGKTGQTIIKAYDGYVYTKKDFVFEIKPHLNKYNTIFSSKVYKMFDTGNSFEPEDVLREMSYEKLYGMFKKLYEKII